MFKSLKRKPEKVKEKLDFKLGFHATRVPLQGWDKLVISVIPYETGRPVAKTPRAVVKNGECHWPDSIIETTRMVYDTRTNLYEEKKYKFMVSSGSSRTGVLGEVTINFGDFAASKHPQQKGMALRNCTTGTLLHVTVTCLTPKSHDSVKDSERTTKPGNEVDEEESVASDSEDVDKPNRANSNGHVDSSRKPSLDSPPLSPSSASRKLQQRGISTSSLRYSSSSFDSLEVPSTPGATSFTDSMHGYPGENLSSSSSFASQTERSKETVAVDSKPTSPLPNLGHKRNFSSSVTAGGNQQVRQTERTQMQGESREVSGVTVEDFRKSSLKLSGEVEDLNRKLEKNIQVSKEKEMEVSALTAERDGLKQEVEKLKSTNNSSRDLEIRADDSRRAVEDAQRVIQELKVEIMSEKNTISSLNDQLQKTQQCNLTLVSEIDELLDAAKSNNSSQSLAQAESDWIKKLADKDGEIKDLQARIMHFEERNSQIQTSAASDTGDALVNGLQNMVKQLQQDVEELEADTIRLTDENSELHSKLESSTMELSEKSKLVDDLKAFGPTTQSRAPDNLLKQLQEDVEELEAETNRLNDENAELQAQLKTSVSELNEKNRLIADLKASESTSQPRAPDNLLKQLQQDVEELEAETIRLTDENEELRANLESSSSEISEKNKLIAEMKTSEGAAEGRAQLLGQVISLEGELNRLKDDTTQIFTDKQEAEKSIHRLQAENQELQKSIRRLENSQPESFGRVQEREVANTQLFQQLAETVTGLEEELQDSQEEGRLSRLHVEELEREILVLTSSDHSHSFTEMEALRNLLESEKLDKENIQRSAEERTRVKQEHLDHVLEESEYLKDKLEELLKEMQSAAARAAELEFAKSVLEGKLGSLEDEKLRISNRVSGLELQLKYMTEERDQRQRETGLVEEEKSFLLGERERLQNALDSTTQKHQELVRHLTEELDEAIKECEGFKSSQHQLEQEVVRLRGDLEEAHHDQLEHTKIFENSRAMLEESFHSISNDHANAVAVSKTLEAQVAQLQSDLEDMDMRSATEVRTLSMLKESEQHRAEKAEQALQQSAVLQKENSALQKRVTELELLLEDERASYSADKNGASNGHRKSSNGHESREGGRLKTLEMEKMKQDIMEKESSLLNEIERLELANEQLIRGAPDSDLQQLQVELTRLQNQNAALNRHLKELESQLNTRDMLQSELERMQEVNEKLDNRLQKYKAAAAGSDMVEKVVRLETELAEALEANNMYKSQLRTAFAEQQNVHSVALQNFGDVDTVVNDLVELRKRVKQLECELRDMRDRYSAMSLRFAEVEGEREELVMTIRTLRNTRR